ncbi:MAG: CYTH domain-containing protein [Marinilabiliales bacterium]|nr:CYTH domain-containing protein [Marinilabiliales bacterium]
MAVEIERKFLLKGDHYRSEASRRTRIRQGYLSSLPERTVRVRIKGEIGYLTVKGAPRPGGLGRFEWEKPIGLEEAEALMLLCEPGIIDKYRYEIPSGNHIIEVDEFLGENDGLVLAEIELTSETEDYPRPEWLGEEVTGDPRYFNAALIRQPYKTWAE